MKFAPKRDRVDSRALQLSRERLQFPVSIRERLVPVFRYNDLPAPHPNFKSLEPRRDASNRFVSIVQAPQRMWMMSRVKPGRVQQHVESPERALGLLALHRT